VKYVEVAGVKVSAIGLGTWQFGSTEWGYGREYADREAGAIVGRALDVGITFFDTAEIYGFGRSERILGKALAGRRHEAFIASKLFPLMPIGPVVLQRARASVRRLGIDALDLYQIHQPNPVVPLSATMPAFAQLMDEGTIRHAGVSNFSLARWQAAESALGRPVLSNQVRYNLVDRRPERDLLPWAQSHDRLVIAYSPLAQGLLSGKYGPDRPPSGMVRSASPAFMPENLRRVAPLVETLAQVAKEHDATPSQVALAWLIRRPNVVVIPGASSAAQVEANAAAADLELSDDEDSALVAASDAFDPVPITSALPHVVRARVSAVVDRFTRRQRSGEGPKVS
jgi:aryl-alcohol dehydrogenase-like predicted oxidoreductase